MARDMYNQNRINMDGCYQLAETIQNKSAHDYATFNYYPTNRQSCPPQFNQVKDFSYNNYLVMGQDANFAGGQCRVDNDTRLRVDKAWNKSRENTQLPTRVFTAAPNMSFGHHNVDMGNKLVIGSEDTRTKRSCNVLSEVSTLGNVLVPMLPCVRTVQTAKHTVFPQGRYQHVGVNSRDINRQREFLRTQGYQFDESRKLWTQKRRV